MNAGKVVFEIDAETKNFDAQIEKVEKELGVLLKTYQDVKDTKPYYGQEAQLRGLQAEIEKTNNKLIGLKNQQKKLQEESTKTGASISKGFEKGLKSVKKLALGIIGIRSAYMLARRAASAYMSQDEELTKKIQSAWVGLGSFLTPLLEGLTTLMLKFVGYLNEFIKALTGTDYIARANAKALEKQAKAQANLNKETEKYQNYDFDVIRTQQTQTSASSGYGTDSEISGLIEIPELNDKIVKKLQDLAKWLKENEDEILLVGEALALTFGAVAIGKLLSNIATLIGSGTLMTGLAGLLAILGALAVTWVIKLALDGKKELDDMWEKVNYLGTKGYLKHQETHKEFMEKPESEETKLYAEKFQAMPQMENYIQQIDEAQEMIDKMDREHPILTSVFGYGKGEKEALQNKKRDLKAYINNLLDFADAGLLTKEGYVELIRFIKEYGDQLDDLNTNVSGVAIDQNRLNEVTDNYYRYVKNSKNELHGLTIEYEDLLIAFKREHPEIKIDTEEGKKAFEDFVYNTLGTLPVTKSTELKIEDDEAIEDLTNYEGKISEIPEEYTTKTQIEDKDAKKKISTFVQDIMNIPKNVFTTINVEANVKFSDKLGSFVNSLLGPAIKLPGFASGGYVSQPTLAMVGEGSSRGEYMIPDGEDYISRLASEIGKYSGGAGVTNVYLDGRLIQRQVDDTRNRVNFTKNR